MKLQRMIVVEQRLVEATIVKVIEEIREVLDLEIPEDIKKCAPGVYFKSQVLVTAIGRIAAELDVIIPDSCYIFFDKSKNKQLTIQEAAILLIKEAKNGD